MARQLEQAAVVVSFALGERTYWVVSSVDAYRAMAASWPGPEEVVWEIGAATGAATVLIAKRAAEVHAVEKAPEKLAKLRLLAAGHPNLHVIEADALAAPCHLSPVTCHLLFVDVGGDAPPLRALSVAESWADSLHCDRVVVRNTKLYRALMSARVLGPDTSPGGAGLVCGPSTRRRLVCGPSTRRSLVSGPSTRPGGPLPELTVLVERLLEVTAPGVAPRLVEALRNAGFRERKRLQEALGRLGPAALGPLRELVEDQAAPIEARRAAGEVMRGIVRERGQEPFPASDRMSASSLYLSGETVPDPVSHLRMLASEDELVRHLGRSRLRKARVPEVRALVEALFRPVETVENVIKVLDALAATGALTPATTVDMALDTAESAPEAVSERLFCSAFGLSDQKWGKELVAALESAGSARGIAPLPHLSALFSTLQRRPEAARRMLASTSFPPDLRAALLASPHPNVRSLGE
ncbi:MAG: hypothetical protein FJX75_14800 [Armatimonadetes bacterium]|nr:hypothetical protein [Armatimonadota bacterium]